MPTLCFENFWKLLHCCDVIHPKTGLKWSNSYLIRNRLRMPWPFCISFDIMTFKLCQHFKIMKYWYQKTNKAYQIKFRNNYIYMSFPTWNFWINIIQRNPKLSVYSFRIFDIFHDCQRLLHRLWSFLTQL